MTKLFAEEQAVLDKLLLEWYQYIEDLCTKEERVFQEKAKQYDRVSPVWERITWPLGFVQELRKKTDRTKQLLDNGDPDWAEIEEELIDIARYAKMLAAINRMVVKRRRALLEQVKDVVERREQ